MAAVRGRPRRAARDHRTRTLAAGPRRLVARRRVAVDRPGAARLRRAPRGDPRGGRHVSARDWDYIIVGAVSEGCVLARRLSDDRSTRVLLLEAGGRDWSPYL